MTRFRCAAASLARDEPIAGTASTVRAFLLLENAGPWGENALRDARLPDGLGDELTARAAAAGVRVLLIRRPGRAAARTGSGCSRRTPTTRDPWLETTELADIHEVHDLDVEALGAGPLAGAHAARRPAVRGLHARPARHLLRRARPTGRRGPGRRAPGPDLGGLAHRRRPVRRQRAGAAARPLLRAARRGLGGRDGRRAPGRAAVLEHLRGRSGLGTTLQDAEIALRRHLGEPGIDAVRFVSRTPGGRDRDARCSRREGGGAPSGCAAPGPSSCTG